VYGPTVLALRIFDVIESIEEQLTTIQQQLQEVRELVDTLATEELTEEEEDSSEEDTETVEEEDKKPSAFEKARVKLELIEDARRRAREWAATTLHQAPVDTEEAKDKV
jgi:regulator of replication initiation timing